VVPAEAKDHPILSDLTDEFDCSRFDCREVEDDEEVNSFFRTQAAAEHDAGLNLTRVLRFRNDRRILGFVTLSMGQVTLKRDGLNIHPVGCVHIAYLGIQREHKHKGWGTWLLAFAISEAVRLSSEIGCRGVGLHCRDGRRTWYEEHGFEWYGETEDSGGRLNKMFFDIRTEPITKPTDEEGAGPRGPA